MNALTLSKIAAITGGQLVGADVSVSAVCTDTRKLQTGDLFVALKGEHFDGNTFVAQAAASGAGAALVNSPVDSLPCVVVADSYRALGLVAREHRRHFAGPVMAITGSSGKTSTKEMLASILRECGDTFATKGNLNNEVGVPLSLLSMSTQEQFAVIEMGAAKRGDIAYLCEFAEPTIALLTNAQAAHIQGFGSLQGVAETKGEIFQALGGKGVAIINADDQFSSLWQQLAGVAAQVRFGFNPATADVWAEDIVLSPNGGSEFRLVTPAGSADVVLALPGRHMIANALAAAAAAQAAGASLAQISAGLGLVRPSDGRLSRRQVGGIQIIDDSYNANPGSVRAAIDVLSECDGRRILVLGAMAELGDEAERGHREVAQYAASKGIDALFVTGEWAPMMAEKFGASAKAFADRETLASALVQFVEGGDAVLIKGSRSAGMELVVSRLAQHLDGKGC
ncbi:UDP-N-acetylmuramoyl-tripeptide--D-alanyl-D-alanine ligase [Spongiibacter taiwanensis]|uniref:UDP-N-acetylmuramoyl-tripeptide--D-alanyl-D- alanine ligase n=1 Tax=Spongiibacter taiwanensis TaxID=1748242 RepID=UPI002034C4DA|nr:UDP-N-acetylmuramoyl-tripeptide--D-alanyl-D-alanine ligase [Spongiibacter taiwanensis]USA44279.1 UDP-N-acetylmuramoyl-tripeptide--D-alanyl-D-alanine ligase [Spongiibacter taiwanensis]